MAFYQEASGCGPAFETAIFPPPLGSNVGNPALPTVCGELPDAGGGGDPPPPPPNDGGGPKKKGGGGGFDPPWPPAPPGITGDGGGGVPPGPGLPPTLTGPDGPDVPGAGGGPQTGGPPVCGCVFTHTGISIKDLGNGCARYTRFYYYTCKKITPTTPSDPYDGDFGGIKGDPNNSGVRGGTDSASNLCAPTNCGGNCPKKWIQWESCEGGGGGFFLPPVVPGPNGGGGGGGGDPVDGGGNIGPGGVGGGGGGGGGGFFLPPIAPGPNSDPNGDPVDGGLEIGGQDFGENSFTNNTNSNLPGHVVRSNPNDPYGGGIYRPLTPTNSNLPSSPVTKGSTNQAAILGVGRVPSANLPSSNGTAGRRDSYNSMASEKVEPFVEFLDYDPTQQMYDVERNVTVQSSLTILRRAEARVKSFGGKGSILNERIRSTLNDVIKGNGGDSFVPYNGVTAGSFIHDSNIIKDSLNQQTLDALAFIKTRNLVSLSLDEYLVQGVREAILKGDLNDYSSELIIKMARSSLALWPNGLPVINTDNSREAAYNLIRQGRRSLDPTVYTSNGNSQSVVRRTRQVPTDIDLTLPITTQRGLVTGVRFNNNDELPVSLTGGTIGSPKQESEFFSIVKQDGTSANIALASNRPIAYAFDSNQRNVIEELLSNGTSNGVTFEVSSSPPSPTDIEVCSVGTTIPEILIFSGMRETLTDTYVAVPEITGTEMTYELAWQPGDADSILNDIVGPYVGPRATFYLSYDDPLWSYLLNPVDAESRSFIKVTFNSLTAPLDGKVYPRQIYTDFAFAPTDLVDYNPLQGRSILTSYEPGVNITREIEMLNSPFQSVQSENYVKSVTDGTDISGEDNIYGMRWVKNFRTGEYTVRLSKDKAAFTTVASTFQTIFNTIKRIDDNYNLEDGYHGRRVPMGDLVSFLNLTQFIQMHQIPEDIRFRLFNGVYNDIKVYSPLVGTTERTYITSDRLTGIDLEDEQLQTVVPERPYFNPEYKGKLF
tara:strand:+ start:27335 stop:30316 length:2982 start_codon:yes stop_codon:yes gene_type:complete